MKRKFELSLQEEKLPIKKLCLNKNEYPRQDWECIINNNMGSYAFLKSVHFELSLQKEITIEFLELYPRYREPEVMCKLFSLILRLNAS